jgi:hypothetical protein
LDFLNIYCGPAIWPHDEDGLEKLAHYIIRASFSKERMTYIPAYILTKKRVLIPRHPVDAYCGTGTICHLFQGWHTTIHRSRDKIDQCRPTVPACEKQITLG